MIIRRHSAHLSIRTEPTSQPNHAPPQVLISEHGITVCGADELSVNEAEAVIEALQAACARVREQRKRAA